MIQSKLLFPKFLNLSDTIDGTITAMGSRKIKNWIAFPLVKEKEIKKRQDLVKSLVNNEDISEILKYNFDNISMHLFISN